MVMHSNVTDERHLDAERGAARGGAGRGHEGHLLPHGELTCKQAILEVLLSTRPPGARHGIDILALAVYLQVRRRWRTLYESHPRLFAHEPSAVPREASKLMRALPRDVAVPAAQRFVIWAMDRLTQLQLQQQQFMQAIGHGSANSSVIAEVDSMSEADVSDTESEY